MKITQSLSKVETYIKTHPELATFTLKDSTPEGMDQNLSEFLKSNTQESSLNPSIASKPVNFYLRRQAFNHFALVLRSVLDL
jgi:hypothetical protein